MATWVRQGTGTLPSATNADVTGTIELDNATAPGDFDPDAVNSVRIEYRVEIGSGSFVSPEIHTVWGDVNLTTGGNGATLAVINGPNGQLNSVVFLRDFDETDSSVATGRSVAEWETAELNPDVNPWTTFAQDMGPDGVLVQIASTGLVVTVTIDYTPAAGGQHRPFKKRPLTHVRM